MCTAGFVVAFVTRTLYFRSPRIVPMPGAAVALAMQARTQSRGRLPARHDRREQPAFIEQQAAAARAARNQRRARGIVPPLGRARTGNNAYPYRDYRYPDRDYRYPFRDYRDYPYPYRDYRYPDRDYRYPYRRSFPARPRRSSSAASTSRPAPSPRTLRPAPRRSLRSARR
jgi:hypothetical protein